MSGAPPVSVCHLVQGLEIGGLEIMVLNLIERLDLSRFRPSVCCFDVRGALAGRAEADGIPVHLVPRRPGLDWRYPFALARFLRATGIQVLQLHNPTAFFYGALAGRLARVPCIIYTEHGRDVPAGWKVRLRHRLLARLVHRVVVVAAHGRRRLTEEEGVPAHKIKLIYNGIDGSRFRPEPSAVAAAAIRAELGIDPLAPVAGIVARLDPIKNHDGLIRAMAGVVSHLPEAVLVVIGDGPRRSQLEALVAELGLDRHVRFTGARTDVPALMGALDLFVLPSHSEGLSLTLVEACAAGRPIVATDVGGNGEVVMDGHNGLLVPANDVRALGEAMQALLSHPARAQAMGRDGRRRFEAEFTQDGMVRAYESLYEECFAPAR